MKNDIKNNLTRCCDNLKHIVHQHPCFVFTPAFSVTCIGDIFVHLLTCHLQNAIYVAESSFNCETGNFLDY